MTIYTEIKKNTYFDSVSLMALSSMLSSIDGIETAAVMMGTEQNRQIMKKSGISNEEIESASPNDLMIGLLYDTKSQLNESKALIDDYFNTKKSHVTKGSLRVKTVDSAIKKYPDANFAIISVPGKYAKKETMKALENDMHVLLFSDNVSMEEEIALKEKAIERNLLMMGPDCGTAIINGKALGFANNVRRGTIGMVAAAGTGLQEATVLVDKLGGGISQAIGTGGRDVKEAVGGRMMLQGMEALDKDDETDVIVLISKPPSRSVMTKLLEKAEQMEKPVIACLLGGDYSLFKNSRIIPTQTLEDAAATAVNLAKGEKPESVFFTSSKEELYPILEFESRLLNEKQKYVRGLYSGGTLCYEGMLMFRETVGDVYSNVPLRDDLLLEDSTTSKEHTFIDMGEDEFTNGLPHPMIDTRLRKERIIQEAKDEEVAVILLDIVLGFGSHEDPVGSLIPAISEARNIAAEEGRNISFVASVCGTEKDNQSLEAQQRQLKSAGVIVMPSNAQAARMAALITLKAKDIETLSWEEKDGQNTGVI